MASASSYKIVGLSAVAFGLLGCLIPTFLLTQTLGSTRALGGHLFRLVSLSAILSHGFLVLLGVQLLRSKSRELFRWFMVIEVPYTMLLGVAQLELPRAGLVDHLHALWMCIANLGFFLQLAVGFPLWAWWMLRER
jgi:hypothetical protein